MTSGLGHVTAGLVGRLANDVETLPYVCYLDTMLEGGTAVEQQATRERTLDEIDVLAVATFGDRSMIDELTKKFSLSLWR